MDASQAGQPVLRLIRCEQAQALIQNGIMDAKRRGVALSFVVLDAAGHLVASARMDGAAFITTEVARGKAFASAATGGQPGGALEERYRGNPMVWGNAAPLGFGAPMLPARGSLPIFMDGHHIGSAGASGAPSEIDEAVLQVAIEAIGATSTV